MNRRKYSNASQNGFTLIELMVVVAVIGIAMAVATGISSAWGPNYKLNSAAKDLNSVLQTARMLAVKRNAETSVVFDDSKTPGSYFITADDPESTSASDAVKENHTLLSGYGNGINFSIPATLAHWNGAASIDSAIRTNATGIDGLPYITFKQDGTITDASYPRICLAHDAALGGTPHLVYAITVSPYGASQIRKHNGMGYGDSNNWLE